MKFYPMMIKISVVNFPIKLRNKYGKLSKKRSWKGRKRSGTVLFGRIDCLTSGSTMKSSNCWLSIQQTHSNNLELVFGREYDAVLILLYLMLERLAFCEEFQNKIGVLIGYACDMPLQTIFRWIIIQTIALGSA